MTYPPRVTHLEGKGAIPVNSDRLGADTWVSHGRVVLLAVCRQSGADAEGLVQQPVFQNVDDRLVYRNSLHAIRDRFHPREPSQGTVPCRVAITFRAETLTDFYTPSKCEAYTFLAGSLGSLSLTLWFLPVL